jgi:hypothetical protein
MPIAERSGATSIIKPLEEKAGHHFSGSALEDELKCCQARDSLLGIDSGIYKNTLQLFSHGYRLSASTTGADFLL